MIYGLLLLACVTAIPCLFAAADHLFELEIPDFLPEKLKIELADFKSKCITWRREYYKDEDKTWAIETAKRFLIEIDSYLGVQTVKAQWS